MIRGRRMRFQGKVSSRGDAAGLLKSAGDAVLIERGRPRWLLLSCPCGCGEEFPINLDPQAGPAWRLYGNHKLGWSLFPSVWRETGCKSHYIVWRNRIYIFGRYDDDLQTIEQPENAAALTAAVRGRLQEDKLTPFAEIAESVNAIPWDVLVVCRTLVRQGIAREGRDKQRGSFGLV